MVLTIKKKTFGFEERMLRVFKEDHQDPEEHSDMVMNWANTFGVFPIIETKRFKVYEIDDTEEEILNDKDKIKVVQHVEQILNNYMGTKIPMPHVKIDIIFVDPKHLGTKDIDIDTIGGEFVGGKNPVIYMSRRLFDKRDMRSVGGVILHEYGHYFWDTSLDNKKRKMMQQWFDVKIKGKDAKELTDQGYVPGRYATKNADECFSEYFAIFGIDPERLNDEAFEFFSGML
jgi:hypothetical protein